MVYVIHLDVTLYLTRVQLRFPRPKSLEGWGSHLLAVGGENSVEFQSCLEDFTVLFILQSHQCI